MIKSMTGYGRAVQTFENREITVEIRSVNNRYLDCSVKLPRVFGFAEDSVKAKVKEEISRGKVDVFISVNITAGSDMKISLNRPVLEGYLSAMKTIAKDYEVKDDISVSSLTRFSDIFVVEKQEEDEQQATQEILSVVSQALSKFSAMRTLEGAALEQDLRSRAKTVLGMKTSPRTIRRAGAFSRVRGMERMVFRFSVTSSPTLPSPRVAPRTNRPSTYSSATERPSILGSTEKAVFPEASFTLHRKSVSSSMLKTSCRLISGTG